MHLFSFSTPNLRAAERRERWEWASCLTLGLALHLGVVGLAASLRELPTPLPERAEANDEIDLVVAERVPDDSSGESPGGGSIEPGRAEEAAGSAPEEPPPSAPAAITPVVPPPAPAEPEPPEVVPDEETLEHGNAELPEPDDLFALDTVLSAEEGDDEILRGLKPRPAWRTTLRADAGAAPMPGAEASLGRHYGTGPGKGGGPEGHGSGSGSGIGNRKHSSKPSPFGGSSGAFLGSVCFIPEGTWSLKSLGGCVTQLEVYTDSFNTPTTTFTEGFPGIERHEWFAILYTGKFRVKSPGIYEFRLASDDGSILEINGIRVIDNDGLHASVAQRGKVELRAGEHNLRLSYFQGPRMWVALQLWVTPPGEPERLFGPSF